MAANAEKLQILVACCDRLGRSPSENNVSECLILGRGRGHAKIVARVRLIDLFSGRDLMLQTCCAWGPEDMAFFYQVTAVSLSPGRTSSGRFTTFSEPKVLPVRDRIQCQCKTGQRLLRHRPGGSTAYYPPSGSKTSAKKSTAIRTAA
jgi:hypothetical protein